MNNDNNNNNNNGQPLPPTAGVVRAIAALAAAAGHASHVPDLDQVRLLLQVVAGQVDVCAQLYWEDYVAQQAAWGPAAAQGANEDERDDDAMEEDEEEMDDPDDFHADDNDDDDDAEMFHAPPLRNDADRRLAVAMERALEDDGEDDDDDDNEEDNDNEEVEEIGQPRVAGNPASDEESAARGAAQAAGPHYVLVAPLDEEDDQDDEAATRRPTVRRPRPPLAHKKKPLTPAKRRATAAPGDVERLVAHARTILAQQTATLENLPVKRVSETLTSSPTTTPRPSVIVPPARVCHWPADDWVWAATAARDKIPPSAPSAILWGKPPVQKVDAAAKESDEDEKEVVSIPVAWLRTGLSLDETTALGLVLSPAAESDIGHEAWRAVREPRPPLHCRAVTAILSIVTALLHTGAGVTDEGRIVCGVGGTGLASWVTLAVEERQHDYDRRLIQALTCLLTMAATAARRRKVAGLHVHDWPEDMSILERDQKRQAVGGKIARLCPVLAWPLDGETVKLPTGVKGEAIPLAVSFSCIQDLSLYVASHIKTFQKSGGVALLLETLVQIHGATTVEALLAEAQPHRRSLIQCTCQAHYDAAKPYKKNSPLLTQPTECIGPELISLLLTGNIESSWQGWSIDPFDFGFLSDKAVLPQALTRPDQPMWVLVGPTAYTCLWADAAQPASPSGNVAAGTVVTLSHWNAWYADRHLTHVCLSMGRYDWKPPEKLATPVQLGPCGSRTLAVLESRRRQRYRRTEERRGLECVDPNVVFSVDERAQVRAHPDDTRLYPDNFRLWRYDVAAWADTSADKAAADNAKPDEKWRAFFRLSQRQQRLVEGSLGPAICNILRTRWPTATLDALEPDRPYPVV
jgi:hypothetical protein